MDFGQFLTLDFWNGLVRCHFTEVLAVLTAAIVVVLERYVRRAVNKQTHSLHAAVRFLVFLLFCTIGYAALTLGVAWLLKTGYALSKGAYAAPGILVLLLIVAWEAQRQRQM
ncbi:MAG: DUF3392 family protein [Myxococcales bacterium]|jgi:hypothetical protein|nr:DUF3392 family protein [Myxococcales bacterium]